MDNKLTPARRGTLKILLLAVAVSVILNWSLASSLVSTLLFALEPVIYGVAVALALNAPTQWIEKLIARCDRKGVIKESVRTWIAVLLVLAIIGAVLYMAVTSMVPQMIRIFERVMAYLQTTDLQEKVRSLLNISVDGWEKTLGDWVGGFTGQIGTYIRDGISSVVSVTSSLVRLLITLTLSVYILSARHVLHLQFKRVASALLPEKTSRLLVHTAAISVSTVSTWFGRQLLEGIIFGSVMAAVMLILGLPYVVPISFFSACLYMLPYIGSWLIFFQGFLIMMSVNLRTAVIFGVMVLVLQFLDGNILNPHLVGGSIGLPPWLALASICVFGVLFGIPGMFLGVPAAAVIATLVRDLVRSREAAKAAETAEEDSLSTQ